MRRGARREIGEADVTIKESSGNVFVDLDLEDPEGYSRNQRWFNRFARSPPSANSPVPKPPTYSELVRINGPP